MLKRSTKRCRFKVSRSAFCAAGAWRQIRCFVAIAVLALLSGSHFDSYAVSQSQELTVAASFQSTESVESQERISLRLSRPLGPNEGTVAIFIGGTDVTALFAVGVTDYVYQVSLPLPPGENPLTVYMVTPENQWRQIASFTLRVGSAAPPEPSADAAAAPSAESTRKASIVPSVTLGLKSQAAQAHFPDSNAPQRERFTDFTMQGSLRMEMGGAEFGSQLQFDVAGSSYRSEALRFGELGEDAPLIDLSSYLMQFQVRRAKFQVGHISFGSNRHLINSFSSRGISVTLPVTRRTDVSLSALNGTSVIGWDNFIGLNRRKHQVLAGTLGFEMAPETPGRLRIEGGILHGSLLPISNFNQGNITDAEQSKGFSFRVIAATPKDRLRLDAGFTRSRFNNAEDPALNQSFDVVSVRPTTRNARYLNANFNLLDNVPIGASRKASLAFTFQHETIDPLFRSVASFNQADRFQNQFEAVASIADVTATVSLLRLNDNLDDIPSILKTLTRRTSVLVGAPLASVFGEPGNGSPWWPRVSYGYEQTHQFGAALPTNSDFDSASQIPDQISTNQTALADWQFQRVRFGYRMNRSFQNNQQPGREQDDLSNLINAFTVGFTPHQAIDLNLEAGGERAENLATRRVDRTNRAGVNVNWRMTPNSTLGATLSTLFAGDGLNLSKNRNAEFDLQWSYRFVKEQVPYPKVQGQFFIRYANRYTRALDRVFGLDNLAKLQTLNLGLSFTFF